MAQQVKCPTIDDIFFKFEMHLDEHTRTLTRKIVDLEIQICRYKSRIEAREELAALQQEIGQKNHVIDILTLKLEHQKELAEVRLRTLSITEPQ